MCFRFDLNCVLLRRLIENAPLDCTGCPHDYIPDPTKEQPRRCTLPGTTHSLEGIHCGEDTGLGSLWEANLRMPTLARWPGRIQPATESMALVSSLDLVPTILSMVGSKTDDNQVDGVDIGPVLFGNETFGGDDRVIFLWRDGFQDGPLRPPFGRFEVAAVKIGRIKAWLWTKSAHYNNDPEVYHDPPLLFDVLNDPAEAYPLDPNDYKELIMSIPVLIAKHKESVDWTFPLTLLRGPKYIPCVDNATDCRTPNGDLVFEKLPYRDSRT